MSGAAVRVGVGTRFLYEGDVAEVVEMLSTAAGNQVLLKDAAGRRFARVSVRELLTSDRARVIPDGPGPSADDPVDPASVVLAELIDPERQHVLERTAHVREVLTGYRAGAAELAQDGEPRREYAPNQPLYDRYAAKAASPSFWTDGTPASPALHGALLKRIGPRLNPAIQLRYGTATPTPCRPRCGHRETRAASIPSLFWRGWTLRLNPGGLFDPLPYRQALSVLLHIAGLGDLDYAAARSLLGLPPVSNAVCPYFTKKLRQAGAWEPVVAVLSQLARTLDDHPAPIDYGRRRRWRRLCAATLHGTAWRAACTQIRYRSSERQERFARLHLIELLTGSHPCHFPPPLTLSPSFDGEDYTTFVFARPAQLSAHLHQQAQTLLRHLRIDEPVTWEPPFDWVGTRRFSEPGKESPGTALPSEHELRTHIDDGLRPGQIARLSGCSRQRIGKLMASSGIGPPAPREVLRTLDPTWLREQYEDNHRSFADIAADLGIPPSDLARHARKLGLAIRHGVAAHKHILADHGGPAAFSTTVWAVFASRGAEQRIKRFLAIPGHPDLNHAAKHLGVRTARPPAPGPPTRARCRRRTPGHCAPPWRHQADSRR
ncbi:hypothetical protein ACFXPA_34815 [Amycolatopsis sp. NPDC059090]|uniref:hypothetical protein n=1 Tax=Amycolatopsis sp. NPDC059090 TaxID=3346723 RepID=UPI0036715A85